MSGERDLRRLTTGLAPRMRDQLYVYCTFAAPSLPPGLTPVCTFVEDEGLAAIVEKQQAEAIGVPFELESRMITLTIHSSLEAVGFLAAVSGRLALADIPCNVVSAYHHDHLFIPKHLADRAMHVLADLGLDSSERPALN